MKERDPEQRRTIAAFPSNVTSQTPGLYTHMFVEDISAGLMSFRHISGDEEGRVDVEGDEGEQAVLMAICNSISDYPRRDAADAVQSAIESIGTRLAWFGNAVYEICGRGTSISLASVAPPSLFRVHGGFIQLVPPNDRQWVHDRRYAFLPTDHAWIVQVPRRIGGPRAYRNLLNELTAVSQPAPEFWTRELSAGRIAQEFSVSDYNRARDAYIARLTRRWGGNRRDSSLTNTTEFFYFFRSLRFRQALVVLRNHIVYELNQLVVRLGVKARIQLEGFANVVEIEDLIARSSAGSLHYVEAWRKAR
jgi:hypothetical protein